VRSKICTPTWVSPEGVSAIEVRGGERRLPGALAGPEVGSASEIVTEDLEQIGKTPSKWHETRDPQTRGAKARSGADFVGLARPEYGPGFRELRGCLLASGFPNAERVAVSPSLFWAHQASTPQWPRPLNPVDLFVLMCCRWAVKTPLNRPSGVAPWVLGVAWFSSRPLSV
jgi:hypothetical protein